MNALPRPVLRWHGGKWLLAPWIIEHLPPHRVYVEPFGGAASVLLRKRRSHAEIYNDLDGDVVNLFRVLRSSDAARLVEMVRLTPFARREFADAYRPSEDPLEQARRLLIRSFMGFAAKGATGNTTGFRANSTRSGTTPGEDWANYPDALALVVRRLAGVVIENRPAADVMLHHDGPETLHYVDPPYVHETRSKGGVGSYRHEMTTDEHARLLEALCDLKGMVVLSGYPHPIYDATLRGWERVTRKALADRARPRVEVLWLNPSAATAIASPPLPLVAA